MASLICRQALDRLLARLMGYLANSVGAFQKSTPLIEWPDAHPRVHPFRLLRCTAFVGLYGRADEQAGLYNADSPAGRTFLSPAIPLYSLAQSIHRRATSLARWRPPC